MSGRVAAAGAGPEEPVTMMDYNASITYRTPITENVERAERATEEGRFLGSALPDLRADLHRWQGLLPHRHH